MRWVVPKIRVLVANRPRLMRELVVATISDQPDMEIVGVLEEESVILKTVEEVHPDFLIITLDRSETRPLICDILLTQFPQICILALAPDRDSTMFYWATQNIRSSRVENSEEGILGILRDRKLHVLEGDKTSPHIRAN
jgi:AmiR/NasT family two-component response regulator